MFITKEVLSRTLFVALIVAGSLTAWVAFAGMTKGGPHALPQRMGNNRLDYQQNPIGPGATRTDSIPPDAKRLPFEVLVPQSKAAADQINGVWTRVDFEPAFAIQLASGVIITERLAEAIDFPTDEYYQHLGDEIPGAFQAKINDAPALVIQSTHDLGNPSSVDVILQGVHLSIIGSPSQDSSGLVDLANSIPATGAGTTIATVAK